MTVLNWIVNESSREWPNPDYGSGGFCALTRRGFLMLDCTDDCPGLVNECKPLNITYVSGDRFTVIYPLHLTVARHARNITLSVKVEPVKTDVV